MATPISYLVSTAGHAQYQNEQFPHDILSVNQLVREGAQELGDRPVVGFAKPELDDKGMEKKDGEGRVIWDCQRFCKSVRGILEGTAQKSRLMVFPFQLSRTSCAFQLHMLSS